MASTAGALTGLPAKAPFEIDDVQVTEALGLEGARLRRRIVIENGGLAHLAELEADALAVFQVDGGKKDHAGLRSAAVVRAATMAICSLTFSADQWAIRRPIVKVASSPCRPS